MANGSVLAGVRPPEPVDLVGSFLGGQQARQNLQIGQQQLAQSEQLMAQRAQEAQQQVTRAQYDEAVQRMRIINRLARQVREIPSEQERQAFVQRLDPEMLQSVGVDPAQVSEVGLNDQSLDALIGQTQAVLPDVQGEQAPAGLREFEGLTRGLSPEEVEQARRVQLGIAPRAGTQAGARTINIGGVPYTFDPNTGSYVPAEVGGREVTAEDVGESQALIEDRVTRAKESAKAAEGQVKDYFNQLSNIESNIGNYNEAIGLIDEGASTGVIQRRLPSVRAASQKLDNVQKRLGLDVIGNTTFGALSESELAFAIDSALPTGLEGPELRDWLVQKRDAQQKLADYINNAIQFLSVPGNTLADLQATSPRGGSRQPVEQPVTPPPAAAPIGEEQESITLPNGIVVRRVQ